MKRKLFLFIETSYIPGLSRDILFISPDLLNIGFLNVDDFIIFNKWINTKSDLFKIPKVCQNIKREKFCFKKKSVGIKNWLKLPVGSEYYLLIHVKPISIKSIKALNDFLCKEKFERYEIRFSFNTFTNKKILKSVSEGEIEF